MMKNKTKQNNFNNEIIKWISNLFLRLLNCSTLSLPDLIELDEIKSKMQVGGGGEGSLQPDKLLLH